jgi:glycolate oxidase FAD binding subunit
MRTSTLMDELAEFVGGHARAATEDDRIDGVPAQVVASPGSTEEASALLRAAAVRGLSVVPRGRGTALAWGAPPQALDLVVDTTRLNAVVEHVPGDLICVVQAGLTLDALNERMAVHGQQLALDQPCPGASVGGTLATARSGPRRMRYGAPRDLVLGITMVRADGAVAHAGGKVVKNVAGYDLAKLLTGSLGTLGLITEAVLRLHALPVASRWLTVSCPDPLTAAQRAHALTASQLTPSAVEVIRQPGAAQVEVQVLLEGTRKGVDARTSEALLLLGEGSGEAPVNDAAGPVGPAENGDTLLKVTVPLTTVDELLLAVVAAEAKHGVPMHLSGSAGVGVLYVKCSSECAAGSIPAVVADLRTTCAGGSVVVLQAPPALRARLDAWGPVPGLALMRRVKNQFDPEHRLAPGRFVGGI